MTTLEIVLCVVGFLLFWEVISLHSTLDQIRRCIGTNLFKGGPTQASQTILEILRILK